MYAFIGESGIDENLLLLQTLPSKQFASFLEEAEFSLVSLSQL